MLSDHIKSVVGVRQLCHYPPYRIINVRIGGCYSVSEEGREDLQSKE